MQKTINPIHILAIYLITLVLLAIIPIGTGSSQSLNNTHIVTIRLDYLVHFAIYLPIVYLLRKSGRGFLLSLGVAVLLGVVLEGVQYFLPYRGYNVNDMLANVLACLLSFVVTFVWERVRGRR